MSIRIITIITFIMLAVCALAQPMPDETWLAITVQKQDGTIFAPPQFRMQRVEGNARVGMGRVYSIVGNVVRIAELTPGDYDLICDVPTAGIMNDTKRITLEAGDNALVWTMPPMIPVTGALTLDNEPVRSPVINTINLLPDGKQAIILNPSLFRNSSVYIPGLVAGTYQLIVLSDQGYSIAIFNIEPDRTKPLDLPMPLTKTKPLAVTVTDNATGATLQSIRVTLSCKIGPATINLNPLMTNNLGALVNLPILPPGEWQWTAMHSDYQNATGKLQIQPEGDNTLIIKMTKR